MIEAVIFDMDGLLLDTERIAVDAWIGAAAELDINLTLDVVHKTIGINHEGTKRIIANAIGGEELLEKLSIQFEVYYRQLAKNGIPLKPGALELLRSLHSRGVPVGLATSTPRRTAEWKLESSRLLQYFSGSACGDEVERGKPAPDVFLLSAQRIGAEPCRCVVLEDSPAGILGAKAAGMTTIMVPDLLEPPAEILPYADYVVRDLFEAGVLLRGLLL